MKNIPAKETKRLEIAYKASQDVLKTAGIVPAPQAPLIGHIYNDQRVFLSPIIEEPLGKIPEETIDLDQDE